MLEEKKEEKGTRNKDSLGKDLTHRFKKFLDARKR